MNVCGICLDELTDPYKKWKCNHTFHRCCIENWNKGCPYCRCYNVNVQTPINIHHQYYILNEREKRDPEFPNTNTLNINTMRNYINVPEESKQLYTDDWKKRDCIRNNHDLLIKENYGCLIICADCNLIKTYARRH